MPAQAKVSSTDALDAFRSSLIIYLERARHILDDVQHDVLRTRMWLQHDQQPHWKKQIRLRGHELAQAEQELLTARLSEQGEAVRDRRRAVERARTRLGEAESALERVQRWLRQYDHEIDPHSRSTNPLRQLLDHNLVKAVALLSQTTRVLADYAVVSPDHGPDQPVPAKSDNAQTITSGPDIEPRRPEGGAS
jgi:hypothetical protein